MEKHSWKINIGAENIDDCAVCGVSYDEHKWVYGEIKMTDEQIMKKMTDLLDLVRELTEKVGLLEEALKQHVGSGSAHMFPVRSN